MLAFVAGPRPAVSRVLPAARAAAVAIAALLAGCASHPATYSSASPVYTAEVAQGPRAETEDDGLPAQAPPPVGIRQLPDDPNEPFSPNYGGANPSAQTRVKTQPARPALVPRHNIPEDLPPAFRRQLAAALDEAE